jgi:hypothetical protein
MMLQILATNNNIIFLPLHYFELKVDLEVMYLQSYILCHQLARKHFSLKLIFVIPMDFE